MSQQRALLQVSFIHVAGDRPLIRTLVSISSGDIFLNDFLKTILCFLLLHLTSSVPPSSLFLRLLLYFRFSLCLLPPFGSLSSVSLRPPGGLSWCTLPLLSHGSDVLFSLSYDTIYRVFFFLRVLLYEPSVFDPESCFFNWLM